MNSPKRILFSGNDPGGAHAVAPVVRALAVRGDMIIGYAAGPAVGVFSRYGLACTDAGAMTEKELFGAVDASTPDVFLSGTSGGRTIDKKILLHLKGLVPSVYVLDFWHNYRQRFSDTEGGVAYFPTAVCVMDNLARKEMLEAGIPEALIRITGNPYFEHFAEGITRADEDKNIVLFISQPVSEMSRVHGAAQYGFDEYSVLKSIIGVLPAPLQLSIRLHPREDPRKYDAFLNERVRISAESTLEESLSRAGLVVSMFSPVLLQAAVAGKNVLSYQPGLTGKDPLPTNALGITKRAGSEEELRTFLTAYERGENLGIARGIQDFLAKDATERVIAVIDALRT